MINAIKISNLRNGEYAQFLVDILDAVNQNGPADALNVKEEYDKLFALSQGIEALFKNPTGSIISTELQELDTRRDSAINGVISIIKGYTNSADPVIKAHAARLDNHLSVFGAGIARDNYQSETATLRNIISDWDKQPELKTALNALGLDSWRIEMQEANNLFSKRHHDRSGEMATTSTDSISTIRQEANDAYYALRDRLNAWFVINRGAEPFAKLVGTINQMVETYLGLLDRRVNSTETEPVNKPTQAVAVA